MRARSLAHITTIAPLEGSNFQKSAIVALHTLPVLSGVEFSGIRDRGFAQCTRYLCCNLYPIRGWIFKNLRARLSSRDLHSTQRYLYSLRKGMTLIFRSRAIPFRPKRCNSQSKFLGALSIEKQNKNSKTKSLPICNKRWLLFYAFSRVILWRQTRVYPASLCYVRLCYVDNTIHIFTLRLIRMLT